MDRHSDTESEKSENGTNTTSRGTSTKSHGVNTNSYGTTAKTHSSRYLELETTDSEYASGAIKDMFPPTEDWVATTNQNLGYVPRFISENFSKTSPMDGMIFRGTGDPKNRPSGFPSPSKDKVKELAMSWAATMIGDELNINLDKVKEFQQLLTSLHSIAKAADVSIADVKQQIEKARDQAEEDLKKFVKEEAIELAKSQWSIDWDKIRDLRKKISLIQKAMEAM